MEPMSLPPLPPALILIIDDDADAIRLLSGMIADQAEILFATSGEAGIQLARARRPQLILLDLQLGGIDGFEVCRRLRQDPDTSDCSIVFVTADSSPDAEVRGLEAGAVDFITKPLNPPVVQARVRTHLNLQRTAMLQAQLANQDGLTGLFNRRYVDQMLEREFQRHKRQQLPLAVAFVDIDHFKAYNDHYGHPQGDQCLREVAATLAASTRRPGEFVGRFGGEEFVAVLPYTGPADAQKYGERLCEQVRARALPHALAPTAPIVTVSVGVAALVPQPGQRAEDLLALADRAMYRIKQEGRNGCRLAEPD
ncbi:diguanylate cyclase domain-containing protein [Massilia sp. TS11]|uniref:diguanylate cyclase domain-containing protein n=1 Tax=Massilia sp. TS11 TaxID=2908003 RepID=UPI001EDAD3D2|nr:diguanylate cyclase [Massilia sp. TS11]MCG2586325.1 diguanylate cyclase [Massilia sp. TS11]